MCLIDSYPVQDICKTSAEDRVTLQWDETGHKLEAQLIWEGSET